MEFVETLTILCLIINGPSSSIESAYCGLAIFPFLILYFFPFSTFYFRFLQFTQVIFQMRSQPVNWFFLVLSLSDLTMLIASFFVFSVPVYAEVSDDVGESSSIFFHFTSKLSYNYRYGASVSNSDSLVLSLGTDWPHDVRLSHHTCLSASFLGSLSSILGKIFTNFSQRPAAS